MTSFTDAIRPSPQGVLLSIHVVPGSAQTVFPATYNPWRQSIEIKVRSVAKDNKANTEVLETIARFFQLSAKDVILVSGEKQREKTICLKNVTANTVGAKLKRFFDG